MARFALRELRLSQFRSHDVTRLTPDGRPVAIYGQNGAGKTNILEAISMLSPGRGLRRAAAAELARAPGGAGWKVAAVADGAGGVRELESRAEPGMARQVRIDDKPAAQVALGRVLRILWLVPAMDRLWTEAAEGRRRFLDRMVMSFIPEHAEAVLTYEKAMRERNRLLKDMVREPDWYAALEARLATSGAVISANRAQALARLGVAQEGAATAFPAACLTLVGPEGGVPDAGEAELAEAFERGRDADLRAGRTLTGPHRADLEAVYAAKGVAARLCSTGEQKALLISLVLANARALAEDTGQAPILLLDEVAAHLDAERREALYGEITGLGAQAWMTGTGRELFAGLEGQAQFVEVCAEGGTSRVAEA